MCISAAADVEGCVCEGYNEVCADVEDAGAGLSVGGNTE